VQLPFTTGLALALSALNVHFKDVRDLLANLLTLAFFLTPILYPLQTIASVRPLQLLVGANPLTPFIRLYQELLFFGRVPGPGLWLQAAGLALIAWAVGSWIFERLSTTLVEAV
jgi:ABC-type polysaccharide/polyol phosphate export permease